MNDNLLKKIAKATYFRNETVRRIAVGPMRGMVYRINDITGLSPWYSGTERDHQKAFKRLVKPGDVVMDVGANWGIHTLLLSKLVGPSGLVIALEPLPQAVDSLNWHLDANNCSNVKAIDEAASDEDGQAFFRVGESASTGALAEGEAHPHRKQLTVRTRKLDSLVADLRISRLRLIKIDVEGGETKVLLGAQRTIQKYRPYLVIDLHTPEQDISVARIAASWDYGLSRLSGPPINRLDRGWPVEDGVWGSILASPVHDTQQPHHTTTTVVAS